MKISRDWHLAASLQTVCQRQPTNTALAVALLRAIYLRQQT